MRLKWWKPGPRSKKDAEGIADSRALLSKVKSEDGEVRALHARAIRRMADNEFTRTFDLAFRLGPKPKAHPRLSDGHR